MRWLGEIRFEDVRHQLNLAILDMLPNLGHHVVQFPQTGVLK